MKKTQLKYIPDRVRRVGHLRRKYVKEAIVFRTVLPSSQFLRADHSVDLYKARQFVLSEVSGIVGKVRDYNGGMIYKLNESFKALKASFHANVDPILLEKFFYAITPIEMRSSLEKEPLKRFFQTLQQAMKMGSFQRRIEANRVYVVVPQCKKLPQISAMAHQFVCFSLEVHETLYMGAMLICEDREKQKEFLALFAR